MRQGNILLSVLIYLICGQLWGQSSLAVQLEGKQSLPEIMRVVNSYYEGKPDNWRGPEGNDPKLKHWKRWEWYMSGRLGPEGEFVDISSKLMKAYRQVEKMDTSSNRSINSFWSEEGPVTTDDIGIGRADRIAFHPTNPNIMYVGSPGGGLWKTENAGTTWEALTDNLPSIGISGICISPDNPNEMFILTGDADSKFSEVFVDEFNYGRKCEGVMRSQNGGITWHPTGELSQFNYTGFKIAQQPTNPDVLLVATSAGIYRTENSGASWTKTQSGSFHDVEFLPGTQFAVAAGSSQVLYSLSGGLAWGTSTLDVPLNSPYRIEIEVTPDHPTGVYLLAGGVSAAGTFHGIYKSTNSGLEFTQLATSPNILGPASDGSGTHQQAAYDLAMAVSPTDHETVITGAIRIWRSTNGGDNFSHAGTQPHSDIHDMAYNPLNGNVYACTDGGVYQSTDDGNTWQSLWIGFATSQMYHMRGTPLNNNDFLAGLQDNGIKKRVSGTYWQNVVGADGFDVCFYPTDASKFYVTLEKQVWRMDGTFENVTPFPGSDNGHEWFGTVASHVNDPDIVYVGYSDVFRSDDNGDTWENIGASGTWALATCPSNPNRLYAAGDKNYGNGTPRVFMWDDQTSTWDSLHHNSGFPESGPKITDIGVSPVNSDHVYVTFGGFNDELKVFRSIDAGEHWVNWTANLPDFPINCVAVAGDGVSVYIGTDVGVFYRKPGMLDWMPFRNGFPNVPVTDLYIQNNAAKIFASTFGRGMWSTSLVDACPTSLIVGGLITGYAHFQASTQINTTNSIQHGLGNELYLTSGNKVVLKPGFAANRTSRFVAAIDGCGSGGIPGVD